MIQLPVDESIPIRQGFPSSPNTRASSFQAPTYDGKLDASSTYLGEAFDGISDGQSSRVGVSVPVEVVDPRIQGGSMVLTVSTSDFNPGRLPAPRGPHDQGHFASNGESGTIGLERTRAPGPVEADARARSTSAEKRGHKSRIYVVLANIVVLLVFALSPPTQETSKHVTMICEHLPFARKLPMCSNWRAPRVAGTGSSSSSSSERPPPDFSKLMEAETRIFDKLFQERKENRKEIKEFSKSSMAVRELLVKLKVHGDDMTSKESLSRSLLEFSDDAVSTARALQKLDTKIVFTVQEIINMNHWALSAIQKSRGCLPGPDSVFAYPPLSLFAPSSRGIEKKISDTFMRVMDHAASQLKSILVLGHISNDGLLSLYQKLDLIHEIALREQRDQNNKKHETITVFSIPIEAGVGPQQLADIEKVQALLNEVLRYRSDASSFVNRVLMALNEMEDHLMELRTRAINPVLLGADGTAELHIKSIQAGIRKLTSIQDE